MKRILSLSALALLTAYVVLAVVALCPQPSCDVCDGIVLRTDGASEGLITEGGVLDMLKADHLSPINQPMDSIDCHAIETALAEKAAILSCDCYKTTGSKVGVRVQCRMPVVHVFADNGRSYCLDAEGVMLQRLPKAVCVPVATGAITEQFARTDLLQLVAFLDDHKFWQAQIQQIVVNGDGEVDLIPRVGSHILRIGRVEQLKHKFDKLETFYDKAISQVGWERYDVLDARFGNQVIGIMKQ